MKQLLPLAMPMVLAACSGAGGQQTVDPRTWTCQSLIGAVIEMSQSRRPRILEINRSEEMVSSPNSYIQCRGWAEMSEGGTVLLTYGARISDGGNILLEYSGP